MACLLAVFSASPLGLAAQATPDFTFTTNETLCVLHFMHTASGGEHASPSYQAFIDTALSADTAFTRLLTRYKALDFSSGYRRPGLPRRRYRSRIVMDLLWLQATSATSLTDFSKHAVGLLPVADHAELFDVLAKARPYYHRLVWTPQLRNVQRTERFLDAYADRVGQLFFQVARFYGTPWPADLPFTVALCPIPLATGTTSAVPKVSTLICSYLSENDEDYRATLGVAVHEMCHSIYDEQPTGLQQDIDAWFTASPNPVATHAYSYFNEALATAIGNGWAYEKLNGARDEAAWYADNYIDGFARAIHPLVVRYLEEGHTIDQAFVDACISAFAKTFPDAARNPDVLFSAVGIYADTDDDAVLSGFSDELFGRYRISSSFLRAPLASPGALRSMGYPQLTKVFVVDRDRSGNWALLQSMFANLDGLGMPRERNLSYAFFDEASRSPVVLLLVEDAAGLGKVLDQLKRDELLTFGEMLSVSDAATGN